jgi:hypothetical protein
MADKDELIESSTDKDKKSDDEQKASKEKPSKSEKSDQAESSSKFSAIPNLYSKFVQSFESALSQIIGWLF